MHGTQKGSRMVRPNENGCPRCAEPTMHAAPGLPDADDLDDPRESCMALDTAHWQERLTTLAEKRGVVGATFAIGLGDETVSAATGVLNLRTQAPATPESLFQIGSITKVWTAVLALQLVDEGLIELDGPVVKYLPEFRVADEEVTRTVTVRQLLTHTSGIDGDLFLDTGRG